MLKKYTVNEIEAALMAARAGAITDQEEPRNALAMRVTEEESVYRITRADLEVYREDHDDLTDEQRRKFRDSAKRYIDNNDTFGDTMQICFDMALEDARNS